MPLKRPPNPPALDAKSTTSPGSAAGPEAGAGLTVAWRGIPKARMSASSRRLGAESLSYWPIAEQLSKQAQREARKIPGQIPAPGPRQQRRALSLPGNGPPRPARPFPLRDPGKRGGPAYQKPGPAASSRLDLPAESRSLLPLLPPL